MDKTEALAKLSDARVARLATVDELHRPHLVPFVFALLDGSIVSAVDHKPKRSRNLRRLRNIAANPHVSVLADHYHDDWSRLWWVRIDGRATVITASEELARIVTALTDRYPAYRHQPPAGPGIAITIDRISGWAASDQ